ncbi:hypothetical protein M1M11_23835 [Pseudomonas azerbaijanoccidens]|uniref:hypothetical protein n=1 Tax=Pseudomonas azerbaijanoccidentalis TaxID=2842347 RepID=UPI00200B2AA0|nr:hypothetical protein [Pseudomonas azerbaijanoccidentalis]MCK8667918.1 hypothetical protein [Pseudomonas azerbaijanoccidentalis]
MTKSNIDRFDEYAGLIFAHLYAAFPMRVQIGDYQFMPEAQKDGEFDFEMYSRESKFVEATILWLRDAGYISGQVISLGLLDAVLTSKGLEVLKATPSSLVNGPSLGDRITDAVKEGGKETMRSLVSEALGIGARLMSPLVGLSP